MTRKLHRLLLTALLGVSLRLSPVGAFADGKPPMRWLIGELGDSGVTLGCWASASISYTDNDNDSMLPQSFLNREDGFNINQIGVIIERKPKANIVGRIGPFPGPTPQAADFGCNLTTVYGSDAKFFRTSGWDDEWRDNEDPDTENFLTLAHFFRRHLYIGPGRLQPDARPFPHTA